MTHTTTVEERPELRKTMFGRERIVQAAGWYATCSCGWQGNNPHSDQLAAREAADYHLSTVSAG